MSASQIVFAAGLTVVLVATLGAAGVVMGSARRGRRHRDHAELGRAAFVLHRISGLAIFAFLALHVLDIGLDSVSHRLYDQVQTLYGTAPLRIFECALLFAVLFHTFNGLRLVALDAAPAARWPRRLLPAVIATVAIAGVAGSVVILRPVVG